jgi:lipoyl synthase
MSRPDSDNDRSYPGDAEPGGPSRRKPSWLKKKILYTDESHGVKSLLHDLGLHTVCRSARCPNLSECFQNRRATFLILGNVCTRRCSFCAVEKSGTGPVPPPDPEEPSRIAEAVKKLGISYAVITSVTRDDLRDGGAGQFVRTIGELRSLELRSIEPHSPALRSPGLRPPASGGGETPSGGPLKIEVLTPDFLGREESIRAVAEAGPDVYNHNVETVPRLYPAVRPGAVYQRSLALIAFLKREFHGILLKSGLMVGMGERAEEVAEVLGDLRHAGCDAVTIGQYLQPRRWNHPVVEYVAPDVFHLYREKAEKLGFLSVASGPYVRSSYMAHEGYERLVRPSP